MTRRVRNVLAFLETAVLKERLDTIEDARRLVREMKELAEEEVMVLKCALRNKKNLAAFCATLCA